MFIHEALSFLKKTEPSRESFIEYAKKAYGEHRERVVKYAKLVYKKNIAEEIERFFHQDTTDENYCRIYSCYYPDVALK